MWTWFHKLASPPHFYRIAGLTIPVFSWASALLVAAGLFGGLVLAPPDYQQGEGFRIFYVHVPSAILSMFVYATMAIAAAIGLIWRMKLAHAVAAASAPMGAWFTVCALATGSIWGKPMWGTWWVWDARLTSELILLFLYLGYMGLRSSIDDLQRADRASAVLAVIGIVNLPVIHYSVVWWNSIHQGSTLLTPGAMPIAMKWPALCMLVGFALFYGAVLFVRLRGEVVRRERSAAWLREVLVK